MTPGSVGSSVPRREPAGPAVWAVLAVLGGGAWALWRPLPDEAAPPPAPVAVTRAPGPAPAAVAPQPSTAPALPPAVPAPSRVARPATTADPRTPAGPVDMPYRFIGLAASGAERSIVLFGRGRVVTLQGPGPVDDEYVVEAVLDDHLLMRHRPTGVGSFLPLSQRQKAVAPPGDPEDSARD